MGLNYFTFKGISSKDMGMHVIQMPSLVIPSKNIEKIKLEGRDGFLTNDKQTFNEYKFSIEIELEESVKNFDYIVDWLEGTGELILSNYPSKIYKATIINEISFDTIFNYYRKAVITFEIQPFYNVIGGEDVITSTNRQLILNNNYNAVSYPILKIFGTGKFDIYINTVLIFTIENLEGYITINSLLLDTYKDTTPQNEKMIGDFPVLQRGVNNINIVGGTFIKFEITPNWRGK